VKIIRWAVMGSFAAIITVIIFVKAGKGGGQSGGQQAATIVKAFGQAGSSVATSLEGG
jgi:hypothetical protein